MSDDSLSVNNSLPNPTLPRPAEPVVGAGLGGAPLSKPVVGMSSSQLSSLNSVVTAPVFASANQQENKTTSTKVSPSFSDETLPPLAAPTPASFKPLTPTTVTTTSSSSSSSSTPSPTKPQMAQVKKSPFRFLPFILAGALILVLVLAVFSRFFSGSGSNTATGGSKTPVTLTYWGLWEPTAVLNDVLRAYESTHPNVKISYQQQSYRDYLDRLQTAIAKNQGPDIFRFHASWTPVLRRELAPMPSSVFSTTEFQNTFYPVAVKQLTSNGAVVGVPLEYDGLALLYNQEIFNTANVQPPTTWAEMKKLATQLTIRSADGNKIQRAGLAVGNVKNVDHFSDILGLLLIQNGGDPTDVTSKASQDAIVFYTSFVSKDRVWDDTLPNSTVAFARGDVAMIFAPSWRIHDIQALNPNVKIGVAPVPQLTSNKVTWASYWAEGVNAQSTHKAESWEFLKYMSSADTMQKLYSDASKVRSFGEIYSRKDLASTLASSPYAAAYLSDAPFAKDWYMNSFTHDNGINDNVISYFEDAVNKVLQDTSSLTEVMSTVQSGQAQVLGQYGLVLRTPVSN